MQMVKGGNQTNFIGAQHAVPENVASHIADTHRGDFVLLNVNTPFAKMPLHRNPGAARGNAHAFVVIPLAATGSEEIGRATGREGARASRTTCAVTTTG